MVRARTVTVMIALVAGFGGGMVATLLTGGVHAQADVVTVRQINLVDDVGRLRGVLSGRDERGLASIAFYDTEGQVRGIIGTQETGSPVLRFLGSDGRSRLTAEVQGRDPVLVVGEEDERAVVLASFGGTPVLRFSDRQRARLQMQVGENGAPSLDLLTSQGQRGAAVVVDSNDAAIVTLYGGGQPRVVLGVTQQSAVLNLSDAASPRLVIGVAENGRPSITFINENGAVLEEFPSR